MAEAREKSARSGGRDYWRSLEELAGTEEFEIMLQREFPEQASEWSDGVSRRNFLKLMGASLAFGGLTNCTIQPEEKIVPWVRAPENMIPGKPLYYATAMPLSGVGTGILVESHMGRPTKIEGNPEHPAGLGGTDAITQASILDLYDPDRATVVRNAGRIATWGGFLESLDQELSVQRSKKGAGLRILTETVGSPTLGQQLNFLLEEFPEARWHQYESATRDNVRLGSSLAFGEPVNTYFDVAKADVILSLDADFLYGGPGSVRYARDYTARRRLRNGDKELNRLYVVETSPSSTGSMADHRLALDSAAIEAFAVALAGQLGVELKGDPDLPTYQDNTGWIAALAADLRSAGAASLVVVGDQQAPALHALGHAINKSLGNVGTTVHYTDPLEADPVDESQSIHELAASMEADEVEVLIIVGGNPVFDAPADLDFAKAIEHVGFRAQLSFYEDETSELCHWHVPQSHYLEAWSDIRAYDSTASIVQPLIQPLYNSKSAHELVGAMIGQAGLPVRDTLREYWQQETFADDFEEFWVRALHDGILADMTFGRLRVRLRSPIKISRGFGRPRGDDELELALRPDPLIWDGRFVNNGWLQETPRPVTKLTWDNAALISPATAQRLGVENEQLVDLTLPGRSAKAPVWIVPGQADGVVTVQLGYGRRLTGRVGEGSGFNAGVLRTSTDMWGSTALKLIKSYDRKPLASTQDHHSMEDRHLIRHADLEHYRHHPDFARHETHEAPASLTLYNNDEFSSSTGNAWGMAIDLNACIGCNACAVACQAENNIPVVGKKEVLNGREMAWIRVDRYYTDLDDPEIFHQPMPCQQCENAPCELVCPVGATTHSEEGLNDMAYNRCVGTRYCSNNCPYKVRRFNFLQYADRDTPTLKLQRNPDVTVRARGVMEKCTYCTQRINAVRIASKKRGSPILDGEIKTACEQACPTQAIVFGNVLDSESRVSDWKASPRNYGILTDLNTKPRTTYLARVRNPNPAIDKG
ncbi:MAG: TAT-variant-translocated molybdopterin oxidoreductase [Candidatus Latescibacterota bacterium]|nr:TAT-variant-translocated molybdopterin oxidoreductase [Candidatus Latescibacterota bacterium]